jgi:hypothetical protein
MQTIIGQLSKITTTADQCIRLTVDIDKDQAPNDIFTWLHQEVELELVGNVYLNPDGN